MPAQNLYTEYLWYFHHEYIFSFLLLCHPCSTGPGGDAVDSSNVPAVPSIGTEQAAEGTGDQGAQQPLHQAAVAPPPVGGNAAQPPAPGE